MYHSKKLMSTSPYYATIFIELYFWEWLSWLPSYVTTKEKNYWTKNAIFFHAKS